MNLEWTTERAAQLELLQSMVSEAARINSTSGILDRLQFLEDTAEELLCSDVANLKPSFMDFLVKLCLEARQEAAKTVDNSARV